MQNYITINNFNIPFLTEEKINYYPFTFITEKLLKKQIKEVDLIKDRFIIKGIMFNKNNTVISQSRCLSESDLIYFFENKNFRVNTFSEESKINYNELMIYFKINKHIPVNNSLDIFNSDKYPMIERNIILDYIIKNPSCEFSTCSKCDKIYPKSDMFFVRRYNKLSYQCKCCNVGSEKYWEKRIGIELSKKDNLLKTLPIYDSYKYCIKNYSNKPLPTYINNKDDILEIIDNLNKDNLIDKSKLSLSYLKENFNIKLNSTLTINDIYDHLYGEDDYKMKPWVYKNYRHLHTKEEYIIILKNYIKEKAIDFNIIDCDYRKLCKDANISTSVKADSLGFVVDFNDRVCAGYKYPIASVNYYKDMNNRIFDMKWLIENELNIPLIKLPLYLTKMKIKNISDTMYNVLRKYYNNIFEWVNECYPDMFIEDDFIINEYRDMFDSNEEAIMHDIFKQNIKNIIYNTRTNVGAVEIEGMQPDWLSFTENGCYLIEYFGLYNPSSIGTSKTDDYIKRMNKKIEKYNKLVDRGVYKFLDIYPQDLKDNFKGLYEKIKIIK